MTPSPEAGGDDAGGQQSAPEPVIDRLTKAVGDSLCWLFLLAAGLTCLEVILDWLFNSPTIWVHDSTLMMCATCFLFGGAYALQRREHIRITFLYDSLPAGARWACDLLALSLGVLYLGALLWFAGAQALDSIMRVEHSGRAWDVPMPMVIRTAFALGTLLFLLQALSQTIQILRERR